MEFFKFDTIKKITKSLLDTFNDIQVEKYIDEEHTKLVTVPISFGSKDAASVFSEKETEQLLSGNFNILPRMSLSLVDMERDDIRATSKFQVPIRIEGPDGKVTQYQHNCVPYIFTFAINIATRSLTDLTTILEQILPFFNPNLNLKIRELDWLTEPTTINVELMSVTYDLPYEYDGSDIRICSADVMIRVHGNIYPPIKNSTIIKSVKYYLSSVVDFDQNNKDIVNKFEVNENTFQMIPETFERIDYGENWNKVVPIISDVVGDRTIQVDNESLFRIVYNDDTDDDIMFVINVVNDTGTKPIISKQLNYFKVFPRHTGSLKLSIQAINSLELQSEIFEVELNIKEK